MLPIMEIAERQEPPCPAQRNQAPGAEVVRTTGLLVSVFLEAQPANKGKVVDSNVVVFRLMPFLALLKCDAIK